MAESLLTRTAHFDLSFALSWLKNRLSPERYSHSLGAYDKALELSERFGLPPTEREHALVAALLHDAAKLMPADEIERYCEERHLALDQADRVSPQTWHAIAGAEIVREAFQQTAEETLNAIRYHTTGRAGMTRVEQVVFVADKIEGNTRNPLFTQKVTASLEGPDGLERATLFLMDSTICFLIDRKQQIHPRTIDARNDLLARLKRRDAL